MQSKFSQLMSMSGTPPNDAPPMPLVPEKARRDRGGGDQFRQAPMVSMTPRMVTSIKQAPKGVIPPGLARYLAAKQAKKGAK